MSQQEHTMNGIALYRRIWSYLRRYLPIFIVSLLAMLLTSGTQLAFVHLLKPLVDDVIVLKNLEMMHFLIPAILGLFLLRGVVGVVNEYATSYLSGHLVQTLRQELFSRMLRLPVSYFENNQTGRLVSRITSDVNQITDAGFNVITVSVRDGCVVVGLMIYLFWINWQLALLCFTVFPAVALCIKLIKQRMRRLARENQQNMGTLQQILNENVKCHRIVKIYNGVEYEENRFAPCVNRIRRNGIKQQVATSTSTGLTQFIISIALCLALYFAARAASYGTLTAGDFMQFITAMLMVFDPMKRITNITQTLQRGLAAAESVFGFMDTHTESDNGNRVLEKIDGALSFDKVSFRYESGNKNAIDAVSLKVKPGETLALVGQSGSGKSTLVSLIPRFYLPDAGEIRLDDIPLNDITLASLRAHIALVTQDVVLFNDTIAANIAYGRARESSEAEIYAAAKAANALEFIETLPNGFQTMIGENGIRLSGGQRQRLAIARALLKNAPILILDEATSALDTHSERLVQTALDNLMKDRTTIVIAHRLSTIENANRIAVMDHGHLVELGTHRELLEKKGIYAKLHALQFSNQKTEDR